MHSGAYPTLEAVVRHYSDVPKAVRSYDVSQLPPSLRSAYHGDEATIAALLQSLDFRMRRQRLFTDEQQADLVAFLRSLNEAQRYIAAGVPLVGEQRSMHLCERARARLRSSSS